MIAAHNKMTSELLANPAIHLATPALDAGLAYADCRVQWGVSRARAKPDDAFRGLYISEEEVDELLIAPVDGQLHPDEPWRATLAAARDNWLAAMAEGGRLAHLKTAFSLSETELVCLLLALLPEIDLRYERLFAYLQDDVTRKRPSVNLLLDLLTTNSVKKIEYRALFLDGSPLLRQRLLRRFQEGGEQAPLLAQYVRHAPHLVEFLLGAAGPSPSLQRGAKLWPVDTPPPVDLEPDLVARLRRSVESGDAPLYLLSGRRGSGKLAVALHLASALGAPLLSVNIGALDLSLQDAIAITLRDSRLLDAVPYLHGWDGQNETALSQLLTHPHMVAVGTEEALQLPRRDHAQPVYMASLPLPPYEGRLRAWQDAASIDSDALMALATQFRFTPGQIKEAVTAARDLARWQDEPLAASHLFAASRSISNQNLATLAAKIEPHYGWRDIVLPADTLALLREMVNSVRQRPRVYHEWGFAHKLALGKGLNALFAGESGTGKTMAADIIAGELQLDLYKIDLSSVVSKYIGETEKNLDRIFAEAETSNAVLFFDEADALFGKRSEIKDSHDRYANVEISYLLQRMEAFDGIVILATNLRSNLDEAFTRRLHFIVDFPFPEAPDRERIWQVNVPPQTPLAEDIDWVLLAQRFRLSGGAIRNIILAAAFLAAETGDQVTMAHFMYATRREYQKMGRLINDAQFVVKSRE